MLKNLLHPKAPLVMWFKELTIKDVPQVGGKNASLGEMYQKLTKRGVNIPNGFAITAQAYQYFLEANNLTAEIKSVLEGLDTSNMHNLQERGKKIRELISNAPMPKDLADLIVKSYRQMSKEFKVDNVDVAVRSSATAEDLPGASFAGQQETFLNVHGTDDLLESVKLCFASLYNDRAISYREDKGFDHLQTYLSVGVQKMVRSDKACSGIMFTLDPDTGFKDVIVINATWGLGELIVQGEVIPDEFEVFKPTFKKGFPSIISKVMGTKERMMIYGEGHKDTKVINTPVEQQHSFTLTEEEVLTLADWAVEIENHYKKPMDTEWAKDGQTGQLFIVQARPETIHAGKTVTEIEDYQMKQTGDLVVKGIAVGTKIGQGEANIIHDPKQIDSFEKGQVLVTRITDPDWEPIMKIASAIVTNEGGRTSHAAIVSRELGIPCIVGTGNGTELIKKDQNITVDCSSGSDGLVWGGETKWEVKKYTVDTINRPKTHVYINVGSPNEAFKSSFLPNDGVGLAREEFIIASQIKIHPNALIDFDKLEDPKLKQQIEELTHGYPDKADFYVQNLAQGIAKIGAAFYPKPVIVRFSDFKTNEYASLLGGSIYEPKEQNPMIGWRGASRYYDPRFEEAFGLECAAIQQVRDVWGITNIIVMVPFCRTVDEGKKVLKTMAKYGLKRGKNGLKVYMMCEIPADVILVDEFLEIFDGYSIGSNDLTQLTVGIDRDNGDLARIANENNPAIKELITAVVKAAKKHRKYIGICGQAPSDYPDFAQFLVKLGIDSISLNPDSILKTTLAIMEQEKKLR